MWELQAADGGSLSRIIAQAKAYGVRTLFIKSGDGSTFWSQFNPSVVAALHAAGLYACAWQFVYGDHPLAEAAVGAQAVNDGADCLAIDAETQYQGKYAQAQQYVSGLRARVGSRYPLSLAGFPYVDYHASFPYSVFLGPNGAQYNTPQMYWYTIGTSVTGVYAHTYEYNELYERPIAPLGQVYASPPADQIKDFRSASLSYRASGVSWWDWQEASGTQWHAISARIGLMRGFTPATQVVSIGRGAEGDVVVWAQEHLWNTHERVAIDGDFGPLTEVAVQAFQQRHDLPVTGTITPATWTVLLRVKLPTIDWVRTKHGQTATVMAARAGAAGPLVMPVPKSASLKARGDELGGEPGMGREPVTRRR